MKCTAIVKRAGDETFRACENQSSKNGLCDQCKDSFLKRTPQKAQGGAERGGASKKVNKELAPSAGMCDSIYVADGAVIDSSDRGESHGGYLEF